MTRPYSVVLTGGIGSGKSLVAAAFARLGVDIVDTDLISRELTASAGRAIPLIADAFGAEYCLTDGSLDRRRMREKVFKEPEARTRLETILHPLIRASAAQHLSESTAPYVLLVVPLLVESGAYRDLTDRVLVVDCDPVQQIERVMRRDGVSESLARAMLAAQTGRERRLAMADDVIDNRGDKAEVEVDVQRLHQVYLRLAGKQGRI
jgi:dephospho-CoA kinase